MGIRTNRPPGLQSMAATAEAAGRQPTRGVPAQNSTVKGVGRVDRNATRSKDGFPRRCETFI